MAVSWWGTVSGAGVGAAVGTAVFPVVGTVLGAVIGAGLGFAHDVQQTLTVNQPVAEATKMGLLDSKPKR